MLKSTLENQHPIVQDYFNEIHLNDKTLDIFVCPNCEGNEDEENTFECEGCGRTLPESEMSDVMEMYICNRCEDGMDKFEMLDRDEVSIEYNKESDSWELLKKETKEVLDSGCTGRGLECLINNHDLLK